MSASTRTRLVALLTQHTTHQTLIQFIADTLCVTPPQYNQLINALHHTFKLPVPHFHDFPKQLISQVMGFSSVNDIFRTFARVSKRFKAFAHAPEQPHWKTSKLILPSAFNREYITSSASLIHAVTHTRILEIPYTAIHSMLPFIKPQHHSIRLAVPQSASLDFLRTIDTLKCRDFTINIFDTGSPYAPEDAARVRACRYSEAYAPTTERLAQFPHLEAVQIETARIANTLKPPQSVKRLALVRGVINSDLLVLSSTLTYLRVDQFLNGSTFDVRCLWACVALVTLRLVGPLVWVSTFSLPVTLERLTFCFEEYTCIEGGTVNVQRCARLDELVSTARMLSHVVRGWESHVRRLTVISTAFVPCKALPQLTMLPRLARLNLVNRSLTESYDVIDWVRQRFKNTKPATLELNVLTAEMAEGQYNAEDGLRGFHHYSLGDEGCDATPPLLFVPPRAGLSWNALGESAVFDLLSYLFIARPVKDTPGVRRITTADFRRDNLAADPMTVAPRSIARFKDHVSS